MLQRANCMQVVYMSGRTLFERVQASSSQAMFRADRVRSFMQDFYYYNAELVSFFIINLWLFIYFIYCSTNPVEVELEVQSNKQILLHILAGNNKSLNERIDNATTDAQADDLFKELLPGTTVDMNLLIRMISADNEAMQMAATYTSWKNNSFSIYYLIIIVILLIYSLWLSYVWYYSYVSHSTFFLFIIMSVNIFIIFVMKDPFSENDHKLVPLLESLKNNSSYVRYLKVSGRVLIENTAKAPIETQTEVINTLISQINSTWYYNSLWYTAVANYIYRVYTLINGVSPHITFYNKMTI